jgi:hypothetical protein
VNFLLSYAGKFDMFVEDECAAYVRYRFKDPMAPRISDRGLNRKASRLGSRVECRFPPLACACDGSDRAPVGSFSPKYGHRELVTFGGREGRGMHDHHEHDFHPAPCCPSCGEAMRYLRSIQTFECRVCEVWITEAREPKILEMAAPRAIS